MLFNSRFKVFLEKLKSRWFGPFQINEVRPYGAVVLWNKTGGDFTLNVHRLKPYMATTTESEGTSVLLSDPTPA